MIITNFVAKSDFLAFNPKNFHLEYGMYEPHNNLFGLEYHSWYSICFFSTITFKNSLLDLICGILYHLLFRVDLVLAFALKNWRWVIVAYKTGIVNRNWIQNLFPFIAFEKPNFFLNFFWFLAFLGWVVISDKIGTFSIFRMCLLLIIIFFCCQKLIINWFRL